MTLQDPEQQVDSRLHSLKVRLGRARAAARRAETLEQKIELYRRVKELERERDQLQRNYFAEVSKLVDADA